MPDRAQKISFAQMRNSGVRGLLIYCSDYKCSHLITMSGDGWPLRAKGGQASGDPSLA